MQLGSKALAVLAITVPLFIAGCNQSQTKDAEIVAARGTEVYTNLASYYGELSTAAKNEPDVAFIAIEGQGAPPTEADEKAATDMAAAYTTEQAILKSIADLYSSYGKFAAGKPADLDKAFSNVETAVEKANSGHGLNITVLNNPVPQEAIKSGLLKVSDFLIDLRKQKDLRAINNDLLGIDKAVQDINAAQDTANLITQQDYTKQRYKLAQRLLTNGMASASTKMNDYLEGTGVDILSVAPSAPYLAIQVNRLAREESALEQSEAQSSTERNTALSSLISIHKKFSNRKPLDASK